MRRHILEDSAILVLVQEQIAPRVANPNDYLCNACHTLFCERGATVAIQDSKPIMGHQNVCLKCGRSLTDSRSYNVQEESIQHIVHIIQIWVQPRELKPLDLICHRCYQRAEAILIDSIRSTPAEQPADRIILPNYSRAPDSHARCIFPACNSSSQRMVPLIIRVRLFSDYKYYIPPNCRICSLHLETQAWTELLNEHQNHSFTAAYVEDFCELLKNDKK